MEDANKLYEQLGVALNKQTNFQLSYPSGTRQPTFGPVTTINATY